MTSPQVVRIDSLPQSIDEFVALRDQIARTPEGGAAMMVVALLLYAGDEDIGQQCLTAAVDRERLEESAAGYKGWRLRPAELRRIRSQVKAKAYVLKSYVQGATPANRYRVPAPPYVLESSSNPYSGDPASGMYKVFISSSGASSPRPVTVRKNNRGLWKAYEWSSIIVGVMPPAQGIDDDL